MTKWIGKILTPNKLKKMTDHNLRDPDVRLGYIYLQHCDNNVTLICLNYLVSWSNVGQDNWHSSVSQEKIATVFGLQITLEHVEYMCQPVNCVG